MPPVPGSRHRAARSDSGVALLWQWARDQQLQWTPAEAAKAAGRSITRIHLIIAALHARGLLERVSESSGPNPATWRLSETGWRIEQPPMMIVERGIIIGVRIGEGCNIS